MLQLLARIRSWLAERRSSILIQAGQAGSGLRGVLIRQEGQTTAEYALVILAAAAVAVVLIAWAKSSGKLPAFFDQIIDDVTGSV
jgi:Flp pilus assembly pilin Flp